MRNPIRFVLVYYLSFSLFKCPMQHHSGPCRAVLRFAFAVQLERDLLFIWNLYIPYQPYLLITHKDAQILQGHLEAGTCF